NNPLQQQSSQNTVPNVLNQINQIFSPEEQRSLLQEAIETCKNFEKTQLGSTMTEPVKQSFIRKYINQKALRKIQALRDVKNNNNANNNGSNL
nr:Chain A, Mediator of RNA polymerase II transcription subunit 15 [Saccharomyces cerevisiae]